MAAVLLQVLERAELNKLPKGAQNKLEKFVTELQSANEALRTQHERFKADSEQQYFDIEKRLVESQEQILSATRDLQTLKAENKKLSEHEGSESILNPLYICVCVCVCVWLQQTKAKYEIEAEKRELARLLEKRTQEVENLTGKISKLTETNKLKMELQLKLDDIQSSEASVQHREKRMEQEKELLEKKIEWLTAELKTKTDELLNNNRDKGKEILELQGSLKSSKEQVTRQQHGAATDMETKNQELSRAVEELSKLVKDSGEANNVLEKKVSEGEQLKMRLEAELSEKIKKMEKELENATTKAAGKHCCKDTHACARTKQLQESLYNAYAECQTQLQLEKQETRRVSRVLDEIVQEVESKAPVLKRQREEYEGMQRSMASLCNKLEQARMIYSLQKEKEEAKQRCDAVEREKLRAERQIKNHLSPHQVCSLLVELEEARGNQVTKDDDSSADISSTSEVISRRQLSFRSVEELQRQNQSLLGRLRELEQEKDRQQSRVTSERISELEASVDKLQKEVEQLREQRNQQKQLADSSARQRDMYKALLTHSTGFNLPPPGDENTDISLEASSQPAHVRPSVPATRSTPQRAAAAESAQTAQAKAALKQLNDAFSLYKKEKAENDRMLNETNDRLQRQLTEHHSSHAKLTSQLEFSNKRYEILQETVSAYRREISALQERNQKMAATSQRHEHIIHTMSQDLRQANEKLALEEVRVENLTKERDMLRQAESRLTREKEAILAEQRNQNLLLTNLKTIQLTMERTETDTRQRLNNKIEHLEAELASMKTRMDQEVAQRHALGRTMDAQLLEAKKQLETQNVLQQKTRDLLRSSEQQVTALKAQLASASSSEAVSSSSNPSPSQQELAEVKSLLHNAEEQNGELAEQLKNANATVEQYRAVVLTLEDSLKKEKESRSPLEIRLKESEEVQKQLEKRIIEAEKMKQLEQEERRKALDAVEKQVSLSTHRCAYAVLPLSSSQTKLAGEAQAKYERELMLHAADVEALQELKKRLQQEAVQRRELEEQLNKTSSILQEKTAALSTLEKQLKEDLSNQSRRCEELSKQNALLHQQMDDMATRSRQQQQQHQQQQLDLSFSEEGKTTEQILEILRFVQREKQIAVARCEVSEGEALRYKQRVEHQDRELKEQQEALNAEREKMQVGTKTLAQQEDQLKKMDSITALQETNRTLRMDRDKLQQEMQQAQAKVTKLQSDISPLHHSLSQLSEKNGSLQADKRILEDDLKRWKAKAQQLLNQQKDGDVEERQKLTNEREAQQRRIAQLAEEAAKLKTELASASSNSAQSQLQALRDSVAQLTTERDAQKKQLETKTNDILEKNKTINQVKKIGRRYKTQYEELKAQHDKVGLWFGLRLEERTVGEREADVKRLQEQLTEANQANELLESKNREEQLKQQMADKEEKTKKAFMGAKTKINQLNSAKEQLSGEIDELKQSKEELEVRMNALKSQYEGRLLRLDRELRELRETQTHSDPREEPQDQSGAKVGDQPRSADQRQISLKSPAQDRGSSSLSEPPTANIRPTPSTPSPSNKPSPSHGSKATPRASIRPMVTPATLPIPTPTATVMPTTQTDSQEGEEEFKRKYKLAVYIDYLNFKYTGNGYILLLLLLLLILIIIINYFNILFCINKPGSLCPPQDKEEEDDDEDEDDAGDGEMRGGEDSNERSGEAEEEGEEEDPSEASNTEETMCGASSDSHLSSLPGEGSSSATSESDPTREPVHLPPTSSSSVPSSSSLTPRLTHPRRPTHSLPPRLYIQPPAPELGPPHTQVNTHESSSVNQEHGVKVSVFVLQQHFFDDDDRMVPSTPTLVVPHRTDGFAEAIHSPQVAGLSTRFRFGPPEDLLPQSSASHSDLGQLASQGGLGMYESPLFLAAHDEDGGGRSVPTTPLQVAAPVTVFTESLPSDGGDNMASQSVPMVTASTGMPAAADDGDEVFVEQEGDGPGIESSLESQTDMESTGQSDDASLPSTSQDPGN
uniref:Translocated promoter region, nuclear basket protein n=1 Tax=Seriola dumerili TaxID=41447 RepID=A0A3B4UI63_SERDU